MIRLAQSPAPGIIPGYTWSDGDRITAIGSTALSDILDFYYLSEDVGELELSIVDATERHASFKVRSEDLNLLAESFAPMEFKTCAAQCVFCFVDQNPKRMRDNIYVKDEDYRFSFLYGNYITLTSLGKRGIARVIEQRLSPLYVSVHVTDVQARTRMLGIKREIDVMSILRHLTENSIEVHAQIVLCPGWNDGDLLNKSLEDLSTLHPQLQSISVVPVGLSDHREGLPEMRRVTRDDAEDAVARIEACAATFEKEFGSILAYASDEFYLLLGRPFPSLDYYGDLLQQDTGIGMCREVMADLESALDDLREAGSEPKQVTLMTGKLAASFMEDFLRPMLDQIDWLELQVVGVENRLYGSGITVAGLLSGADFLRALEDFDDQQRRVWLPQVAINHDGVFLDDQTLEDLQSKVRHQLEVPENGLVEALLELAEEE